MITDQDNIESEIICHILGSFQNEDPCNYRFSKKEAMEYLEKCFAAKKILDEQKMIDATILTLYSACEGQFSDYCEDSNFGNKHMEWLHEQMKRIKKQ